VLHVTDGSQSARAGRAAACERWWSRPAGLDAAVQAAPIVQETLRNLYDGMP
jgi:hypothetical protein